MGSIGNNATTTTKGTFIGNDVTSLNQVVNRKDGENYKEIEDRIRRDLNIPGASEKQLDTLRQIFKGINEYDKGYDENKTPFKITRFTVNEMEPSSSLSDEDRKRYGIRKTKNPIYVSITTEPNSDSAIIRMMDSKQRLAIIGPNGGLYRYGDSGRKQTLRLFDVQYGKKG